MKEVLYLMLFSAAGLFGAAIWYAAIEWRGERRRGPRTPRAGQ